ncbi:hypothetical protein EY693_12105 [Enterococcus casseliflavus]|nr:hypothetical protein [Enterococcus casseliflavus]MBO6377055.1 hypothetical protein [Enterococcus casseliflavus]
MKRPTHWFVFLLCSVFKGLPCCVSNFYIISERRLFVNSFLKVFSRSCYLTSFLTSATFLSYHLNRYMSNTFLKSFFDLLGFSEMIFFRLCYNNTCKMFRQQLISKKINQCLLQMS